MRGVCAALLALPLTGCVLLSSMAGPAEGFVPGDAGRTTRTGFRDLKGVIHVHSFLSHDSKGTVAEISAAATSVGLDFLVMTDHLSPYSIARGTRGMQGNTLWITGAEINGPGGGNYLIAFPLRHYVRPKPTIEAVLADVHGQGGLVFIDHAERFSGWDVPGYDGLEIVNLHALALEVSTGKALVKAVFTSIHELLEQLVVRPAANLARYDAMTARHWPFPAIAANDAHNNVKLFGPLGGTLGTYEELFKVVTTHVQAAELSQDAIVAALRAGRSFVVFDFWRDGTGFDLLVRSGDALHRMGASVPHAPGLDVEVHVPVDAEIRLFRDGHEVMRALGRTLVLPGAPPGVYRAEVFLAGERPWIFSSAVRIVAGG